MNLFCSVNAGGLVGKTAPPVFPIPLRCHASVLTVACRILIIRSSFQVGSIHRAHIRVQLKYGVLSNHLLVSAIQPAPFTRMSTGTADAALLPKSRT